MLDLEPSVTQDELLPTEFRRIERRLKELQENVERDLQVILELCDRAAEVLIGNLGAEKQELLRLFAKSHPTESAVLVRENDAIRHSVAVLGPLIAQHRRRIALVQRLLLRLRSHFRREEFLMQPPTTMTSTVTDATATRSNEERGAAGSSDVLVKKSVLRVR